MEHHGKLRRGILAAAIAVTFVTAFAAAAKTALENWRPLKESGFVPAASSQTSSGSASKVSSKPDVYRVEKFTNFLLCGIDNTSSLTDVIMVAGFDGKSRKLSILQIPRDTYAGSDVPSGKYNAVYGHHDKNVSGMETLKARVESDFGIRIDHYAAVTTEGLRKIVDAVGGVDLDVPINMDYDDKRQNLHIHLKKGRQHLDGAQAEQFVRFRKGWLQGDLGRLDAQRIFLAAFMQKLKSLSVWDAGTKVAPAIRPPDFLTDMSALEMLEFYNAAKGVSLSDATVVTMPGEPFKMRGIDYYSVHKNELLTVLNRGFVPQGVQLSADSLKIIQKADAVKSDENAENFEKILSGETRATP